MCYILRQAKLNFLYQVGLLRLSRWLILRKLIILLNHLCAKYLRGLKTTGSELGSNKLCHTSSLDKSFGGQFSGNNLM